jgi:hypothetical protein
VRCSKDSPLDFMLVVLTSGPTAHVRFADAKKTHRPTEGGLLQHAQAIEIELQRKARHVHAELERLVFKPKKITLEPFEPAHVAIATDAPTGANVAGATVLCPTTFVFEPWTSVLFSKTFVKLISES